MKTRLLSTVSAIALASLGLAASAKKLDPSKLPPPSSLQNVTYAAQIKPIFEKACFECHGPKKPKGKLRLDSLQGVLKGSEDGKVIEPGKSAQSVLVYAVARTQVKAMPPKDAAIGPLTPEEVGLIRAWVDQGAK
jgi:mono/diheme cytochrome c family protein